VQSLLGSISKPTKGVLGKIGIFSVCSLHAVVSAVLRDLLAGGNDVVCMRAGQCSTYLAFVSEYNFNPHAKTEAAGEGKILVQQSNFSWNPVLYTSFQLYQGAQQD
jgi:hypothetical protein